jgi:hypothetical protein
MYNTPSRHSSILSVTTRCFGSSVSAGTVEKGMSRNVVSPVPMDSGQWYDDIELAMTTASGRCAGEVAGNSTGCSSGALKRCKTAIGTESVSQWDNVASEVSNIYCATLLIPTGSETGRTQPTTITDLFLSDWDYSSALSILDSCPSDL